MNREIEVRFAGMVPACTYMKVGTIFNINKLENGMVWCYCRLDLCGSHPGMVQLVTPKHIKIMPNGTGDNVTIHELKYSPKSTFNSRFCFTFLPEPVELKNADDARTEFLIELGLKSHQHRVINQTFPVGTYIEENTRLIDILQYKNPVCPRCDKRLDKVYKDSNSYMNQEQFDACKAGDYYCDKCPPNDRGRADLCYWWSGELDRGPFTECFKDG